MKVLCIGDIFGRPGMNIVEKYLPKIIKDNCIDFVIAQGENISNRKGLIYSDYIKLKDIGINAFTMGNHVFAKKGIFDYIDDAPDIIRPLNVRCQYGTGSKIFSVGSKKIRVTSLLGVSFMHLQYPFQQKTPDLFFDPIDDVIKDDKSDYHIIDFHAETTSEKNVLGLYLDGKISALVGTHTHVQTNDNKILPQGTAYITDIGMTGPSNCAIGANYDEVYKRMRYGGRHIFKVSDNQSQFNAVIIDLKDKKIDKVNFIDGKYTNKSS